MCYNVPPKVLSYILNSICVIDIIKLHLTMAKQVAKSSETIWQEMFQLLSESQIKSHANYLFFYLMYKYKYGMTGPSSSDC